MLPLVARAGGGAAVVAVAIGQSVGGVGGLVVSLAWPMTGPPLIARSTPPERRRLYATSIESRGLVFLVLAPVCAAIAALLAGGFVATAAVSAVAFAANGFTAAWYYVGVGAPRGLLVYEAMLRVAASGLAAVALAVGLPVVAYPVLLCAGSVLSLVLYSRHVTGERWRPRVGRDALATVRAQARSTVARLAYGVYQAGAVSIVALVAPGAVLAFSGYDRTQKSLMNAAQAAPDSIISWVASDAPGLRRRQRLALAGDVVLGIALAAAFYVALPLILRYMYAGLIEVTPLERLLAAAGLAVSLVAKCILAHALVPSGGERSAASLLVVTSLAGAVLIAGGAALAGTAGALAAIVVAELSFVLLGAVSWLRSPRRVAVDAR